MLHLESMLVGYRLALNLHGAGDDWPFWSPGDQGRFAAWLGRRSGQHSSLGWAMEIEREAEASGREPVDLFFCLFDEYRAAVGRPAAGPTSQG
ncbi:hypothetical protein [Streptomyces cavernicola]|uniref:SAV-6107-like HEPN domain-containing protein n=1 Tax=Streptomyces cavernicola TaxID=3043613 RepID=A0ABT6SNU8_9ACTN|nr:hypothetical protein [Streptomyces sp. B-S-A6]MDI3409357.1 hypothetical protein [Streptomyces sp. B-S-A6]